MQKREDGGIVICCDYCETDWDEIKPMVEGHRGSVLCLECLKFAVVMAAPIDEAFDCNLCQLTKDAGEVGWRHPDHGDAAVCIDCIMQAAGAFTKDPDVDWQWDRKKPWKQ